MRSSVKRLVASSAALAVTLTGAIFVTAAPASASTVVTDYGLQSIAYGTRVISNNVSLNTGRTALAWIACTRLAGVNPDNHPNAGNYLADAGTPENNPWVSLGAVTSRNWSFRNADKGIVGITATNRIASISLSGPSPAEGVPGPVFQLEGLATKATAFAEKGVLKAETDVTSKSIELTLPEGTPIDQELADLLEAVQDGIGAVTEVLQLQEDQAIEIPGLGVVRLGYERIAEHRSYASAAAFTLLVDMAGADATMNTDDDSTVQIGRSRARINRGLPAGVMNGFGYALELSTADGLLNIGRAGMQVLPCQGTGGEVRGVQVPAQDVLDGALDLGSMYGLVYGLQNKDGTGAAWTKGKVTEIGLGSGDERVVLKGIVGVATVRKKASGKIVRSIKGSTVGSMTIGGEEQSIPTDGAPMELPGLGKIQFNISERSSRGVSVTAVRITLNPGDPSETVINLGNARTRIKQA